MKNKMKIVVAGFSVLLGVGLAFGVVNIKNSNERANMVVENVETENEEIQTEEKEQLISTILSFDSNNNLILLDTISNKVIDTMNLKDKFSGLGDNLNVIDINSNSKKIIIDNASNRGFIVTINNNKIQVLEIPAPVNLANANDIYVEDNLLYVSTVNSNIIKQINLLTNTVRDIELNGVVDKFITKDEVIYYGYGERLGRKSAKSGESIDVLLGDKTEDLLIQDEKLYVANSFGKGKNNSVLFIANTSNLKIDTIINLGNVKPQIYGADLDSKILVVETAGDYGIKTVDIEKQEALNSFNIATLKEKTMFGNTLVYVENNEIKRISLEDGKIIETTKAVKVDGEVLLVK